MLHGIRAIVFDAVGTMIHPMPPAPVLYAEVGRRLGSKRIAAQIAPRFIAAFAREEAIDHANGLRTSETREIERGRPGCARCYLIRRASTRGVSRWQSGH